METNKAQNFLILNALSLFMYYRLIAVKTVLIIQLKIIIQNL